MSQNSFCSVTDCPDFDKFDHKNFYFYSTSSDEPPRVEERDQDRGFRPGQKVLEFLRSKRL